MSVVRFRFFAVFRRFVERRDRVALDAFAERFFRRRFQPLRIFELSDVFRDAVRD